MGFSRVSIWRPGLLERGTAARGIEKFANFFMRGTPTAVVAEAMRLDAEGTADDVTVFNDATIRRMGGFE